MLPPFFINLAFFSFIFLMKQILDITDMIVNHKVGIGPVCLLLIYTMPYFLQYVIPMSVMMAVLMTFLRLSGDNEIMALKAGGVSVYRLLTPVLAFSLFGTLLTGYMTLFGVPHGASRFKTLLFNVATANLNVSLERARTFNDNFKQIMLYVNKIDSQSGELHNVLIEDSRTSGGNNTVVARSREGSTASPRRWSIICGCMTERSARLTCADQSSHTINFETYDIRLDLKEALSHRSMAGKRPDEMRLSNLRDYLKAVKGDKSRYLGALLKYHKKFSIPVACLAMGLLAVPLGIQARNSKKPSGSDWVFSFFYSIIFSFSGYGFWRKRQLPAGGRHVDAERDSRRLRHLSADSIGKRKTFSSMGWNWFW
jgi:lipopolysaccharide export system permease protein